MKRTVTARGPLRGEARVPGDKSISHRTILLAALAEGSSTVDNLLVSGVTRPLLHALSSCRIAWSLDGTRLSVRSPGRLGWEPPAHPLYCGHSATSLRLLAGALAAVGQPAILDGSAGLRRRPMGRLIEPLRQMGVLIHGTADDRAPLTLQARLDGEPLLHPTITLPVASAQVKSALLLAALASDGPVELREPVLSRDHTERLYRWLGLDLRTTVAADGAASHRFTPPRRPIPAFTLTVPGDFSSAAFVIVAALIVPGSQVTLRNVGLNPGRTGLLDALREMGAAIRVTPLRESGGEPAGDLDVRHSRLRAIRVSGERVVRMIDEFPIFAVAAACAAGRTEVADAGELRHKESDRIDAISAELSRIGAAIRPTVDGFTIDGGQPLDGGAAEARGDHRLAMSLAVAGLASRRPVEVEGAELTDESFPAFWRLLEGLGAGVEPA